MDEDCSLKRKFINLSKSHYIVVAFAFIIAKNSLPKKIYLTLAQMSMWHNVNNTLKKWINL